MQRIVFFINRRHGGCWLIGMISDLLREKKRKAMFNFHLKSTIENIVARFCFSFVNRKSLVIGISTFILVISWVKSGLSSDNYRQDQQSVFKIITSVITSPKTMAVSLTDVVPGPAWVGRILV